SGCSAPQSLRSAILAVLGDLDVDPDGCLPGPPLVGVQVLPEFLDLLVGLPQQGDQAVQGAGVRGALLLARALLGGLPQLAQLLEQAGQRVAERKSTRLNSSHVKISYAVYCLKKKND